MSTFKPFDNEEDSLAMDELTIENRLDSVSLYGSLQITKDKAGLKLARELKEVIDATLSALQGAPLPDHIQIKSAEKVDNPFR